MLKNMQKDGSSSRANKCIRCYGGNKRNVCTTRHETGKINIGMDGDNNFLRYLKEPSSSKGPSAPCILRVCCCSVPNVTSPSRGYRGARPNSLVCHAGRGLTLWSTMGCSLLVAVSSVWVTYPVS